MEWSPEIRAEIILQLTKKLPDQHLRPCSFCGSTEWQLMDMFVALPASSKVVGQPIGSPRPSFASLDLMLPFVALGCQHCGNTVFLNMIFLGLEHLFWESQSRSLPSYTTPDE